jgi:hypothetical protein
MANNDIILLMFVFQLINIYLATGEDGKLFLERFSGKVFLILPSLVILSLIWRPL